MSTTNITQPPTGMPEYHPNNGRSGAIAAGDAATKQQMALIGNPTGGKRRMKRGGAVTVTPIQIPYSDNGATSSNLKAITASSAQSTANSTFDKCAGQGAGCTAAVEAGQKAGGRKSRTKSRRTRKSRITKRRCIKKTKKMQIHKRRKVGGKSVTWGCMSGGRTRRHN